MNSARQATIVVPTKNREAFLRRYLRLVTRVHFPYTLIIADASENEESKKRSEAEVALARERGLNISYRAYPPTVRMYSKLADVLAMVTTPYAAVCGDDDFLLPRGIKEGVQFLELNPAYDIVHGRAINVVVHPRGTTIVDFLQGEVTDDSPDGRLHQHLKHFSATLYSLHRTTALRVALETVSRSMQEDHPQFWYRFCELASSCVAVTRGKMKRLQVLYLVRQGHDDRGSVRAKTIPWKEFFTHDDFSMHYRSFRACISKVLVERGVTSLEADRIVDQSFRAYMAGHLTSRSVLWARVVFNWRNQWLRVLQEPKNFRERMLLEIRTPLWSIRRHFSPLNRAVTEVFAIMREFPKGIPPASKMLSGKQ